LLVLLLDANADGGFGGGAASVRDVLSQRWILTDSTYDRENPKRIYYLPMEFLTRFIYESMPFETP
jgi:starch phosphorylase